MVDMSRSDGAAKARTGRRRSAELHAMEEQLKDLQVKFIAGKIIHSSYARERATNQQSTKRLDIGSSVVPRNH